jgi:hypothetical protein
MKLKQSCLFTRFEKIPFGVVSIIIVNNAKIALKSEIFQIAYRNIFFYFLLPYFKNWAKIQLEKKTRIFYMYHLVLTGDWKFCFELMELLNSENFLVSVLPQNIGIVPPFDLAINKVTSIYHLDICQKIMVPWIAWISSDNKELSTLAYQAGAFAVIPEATPLEVIVQIVNRTIQSISNQPDQVSENSLQRRYQRGDIILLEPDTILEVQKGVIAQTMVYQDGTEVLLGLCGPSQLVFPHPADDCYIQLVAHTDAVVMMKSWKQVSRIPDFSERLRLRLQQLEAWAAIQARPHLDQRVLGILSLLAEQFGKTNPQGQLVDIRITHTQLASAVGATRTTITRTLGDLRKQGKLSIQETSDGERFCLLQWEHGHHGFIANK